MHHAHDVSRLAPGVCGLIIYRVAVVVLKRTGRWANSPYLVEQPTSCRTAYIPSGWKAHRNQKHTHTHTHTHFLKVGQNCSAPDIKPQLIVGGRHTEDLVPPAGVGKIVPFPQNLTSHDMTLRQARYVHAGVNTDRNSRQECGTYGSSHC